MAVPLDALMMAKARGTNVQLVQMEPSTLAHMATVCLAASSKHALHPLLPSTAPTSTEADNLTPSDSCGSGSGGWGKSSTPVSPPPVGAASGVEGVEGRGSLSHPHPAPVGLASLSTASTGVAASGAGAGEETEGNAASAVALALPCAQGTALRLCGTGPSAGISGSAVLGLLATTRLPVCDAEAAARLASLVWSLARVHIDSQCVGNTLLVGWDV